MSVRRGDHQRGGSEPGRYVDGQAGVCEQAPAKRGEADTCRPVQPGEAGRVGGPPVGARLQQVLGGGRVVGTGADEGGAALRVDRLHFGAERAKQQAGHVEAPPPDRLVQRSVHHRLLVSRRVLVEGGVTRDEQRHDVGATLLHQVHEGAVVEAVPAVLALERVEAQHGQQQGSLLLVRHVPVLVVDGDVEAVTQLHQGTVLGGEGQAHLDELRPAAALVQQFHRLGVNPAERVDERRVAVVILRVDVSTRRHQHLST